MATLHASDTVEDFAEVHYLAKRYEQEMAAAANASCLRAEIAHLELALRYAIRRMAHPRGRALAVTGSFAAESQCACPLTPAIPPKLAWAKPQTQIAL